MGKKLLTAVMELRRQQKRLSTKYFSWKASAQMTFKCYSWSNITLVVQETMHNSPFDVHGVCMFKVSEIQYENHEFP